ncbi:MAG: ABC transporter substrate-binding protein [Candidatus Methylumidiphilus sp.]
MPCTPALLKTFKNRDTALAAPQTCAAWPPIRRVAVLAHRLRQIVAPLCAAWALSACGPPDNLPLRVGIGDFPPYELMYLAQEQGYFREAGVNVRLVEFSAQSDVNRAYQQGKLDGLGTTLVDVLLIRERDGKDLRAVRVIDYSNGADVILATPAMRSVADLRGRRIAVEANSVSHFVLVRALEQAGLGLADVTAVLEREIDSIAPQAGDFDAIVTYPPYTARLRQVANLHPLFSTQAIPGEVLDVYAFDARAIAERPAQLRAFLQGIERAYAYLQAHREDACRIMARREKMTPEAFCQSLTDGLTLIPPAGQDLHSPAAPMRAATATAVRVLRQTQLLSDRPEVADCLSPL